jgi:hypothetical protein
MFSAQYERSVPSTYNIGPYNFLSRFLDIAAELRRPLLFCNVSAVFAQATKLDIYFWQAEWQPANGHYQGGSS